MSMSRRVFDYQAADERTHVIVGVDGYEHGEDPESFHLENEFNQFLRARWKKPVHEGGTAHCKYCDGPMRLVFEVEPPEPVSFAYSPHTLWSCGSCGWWFEHQTKELDVGPAPRSGLHARAERTVRTAILRSYPVASLDVPIAALRRALLEDANLAYSMHPRKMEDIAGQVLGDHLDCDVVHVGGTRDGGIDLLLVDGDEQRVVQVKRRQRGDKVEGVALIREFLGAMLLGQHSKGTIVSTAAHFTRGAREAASRSVRLGLVDSMDLVDFERFVDIMHLAGSSDPLPWRSYRSSRQLPLRPVGPDARVDGAWCKPLLGEDDMPAGVEPRKSNTPGGADQ